MTPHDFVFLLIPICFLSLCSFLFLSFPFFSCLFLSFPVFSCLFLSFPVFPSFPPSLLPSFPPSLLPPSLRPSVPPSLLPSFRPSFLPSFLPSPPLVFNFVFFDPYLFFWSLFVFLIPICFFDPSPQETWWNMYKPDAHRCSKLFKDFRMLIYVYCCSTRFNIWFCPAPTLRFYHSTLDSSFLTCR